MNVMAKRDAPVRPDLNNPELNNLAMSKEAQPLFDAVMKHIEENVAPISEKFFKLGEGRKDNWSWAPGQLELLEGAKNKAKKSGLWNFFLPGSEIGRGLTNLDYAYIAAELGKQPLASESLNCSAPDTGNMEVLEKVGTPEQKEKWLKPLLNGEIRSAYAMTEPNVASSDAKNVATRAELDGDEWVINGEKFYISGAGDPRCKIMITMVKTSPDASPQFQQSQILVPIDTPGVKILGPMCVFGHDHAPRGHMHIKFENVRVPKENILLGEGRGFEISQVRLGPGRIHHCMRSIGAAEKALDLMVKRGSTRTGVRQEPDRARQEPRDRVARAHRDRGHAADGSEGRQGNGCAGQPRGPRVGEHGEGHGAGAGVPDHRPGHPDPRRRRHLAMDAARRDVRPAAHPAPGRRPGRGPSHGGGPRRAQPALILPDRGPPGPLILIVEAMT